MNRKERRANKKKNGKAQAEQPNLVAQSLASQIPGARLEKGADGRTRVSLPATQQVAPQVENKEKYIADFERAKALLDEEKLPEATKILTELLKQNASDHGVYELLGLASEKLKNYEAALKFYTAAKGLQKDRPALDLAIASLYIKTDKTEEGLQQLEACIAEDNPKLLQSERASMYGIAGNTYMVAGDKEKAKPYLEKSVELDPDNLELLYNLITQAAKPKSLDDKYFQMLLNIADKDDSTRSGYQNSLLHYALFDSFDSIKEYETAFDHALKGAAYKNKIVENIEGTDTLDGFHTILARYFSKAFFEAYDAEACESDIPVFILGMPRSGTTLLEQIMQSHPDIGGVGEDALLGHLIRHYSMLPPFKGFNFPLRTTTEVQGFFSPQQIGQKYVDYLEKKLPNKKRIINKAIGNLMFAGFFHIAMPNAKFIHIKRNAMDSCLSSFTKNFIENAQSYTYDLNVLGNYYKNYSLIMEHWNKVLPGKILNINYEDIVDDLEGNARKVIDFIGLPWDDRCLKFHETESMVRTASVDQVRKPIYKSSVGRWKRYGPKVIPLIEALGEAAPPEAVEYMKSHKNNVKTTT